MMESMEKRTILELRGLCRRINSEFYLHDIDLTLREGEVGAIVGRNASGKSTLFSVIMGVFEADSGEIPYWWRYVRPLRGVFLDEVV